MLRPTAGRLRVMAKAGTSKEVSRIGLTEFEILKASHKCVLITLTVKQKLTHGDRFLREDEEEEEHVLSWGDQVAKKYYSNLYREFALCDLKHYKSGKVRGQTDIS